jgi:[acyl-carrier-protein] S-malonyltransferase
MQTEVTQPAVYTMDMAAYAALREALGDREGGFKGPSAVAGFSLGEYAAFTASGIIDSIETGIAVVKKRSLLMKEAGTGPDGGRRGAMAAGMGGKDAVLALVEKARGDDILEAVNFNSPQQTVVAGDAAAVERFAAIAKEDRSLGVKAVPLPVSGAFHSPIMRPAGEGLAEALDAYTFYGPSLPVYLNTTGGTFEEFGLAEEAGGHEPSAAPGLDDAVYKQSENSVSAGNEPSAGDELSGAPGPDTRAKAIMARQVYSPVQWQRTIEAMAGAGVDVFIEVGPGKTLSGLVKKIAPGLTALHVEDAESLSETVQFVLANEENQ